MELDAAAPPALADGINPFVGRTYRIFFVLLVGMALLGFASFRWLPSRWAAPVDSADGILWLLCGWFGWRRPVAVVLPVFGVVTGLALGLTAHTAPDVFLFASVLTLAAFAGLTAYVHLTRQDFSFLSSFLWVSFFVLVIGGLIVPFSHRHYEHVGFAAFGTLVFLCWILYDTSEIVQRADEESGPGIAAFELLLDLIGLHNWLFDLLRETLGIDTPGD